VNDDGDDEEDDDDDEWTGRSIHALRRNGTHGLSVQAMKAYASDRAAPGTGFYLLKQVVHIVTARFKGLNE
jgi:hypothetical protein